MSQEENVQLVRKAARAFQDRNEEALVECFAPSCELLLPRNLLEGGSYRGHDGVRRALADAYETWEGFRFEIREIRPAINAVVMLAQTTNVGKGDAPTVTYEYAYLWRIHEGRIAYYRPYPSYREALDAAGLSERA